MKVTFTCEKCGWSHSLPWREETPTPPFDMHCPNCAKLRYGPLDEEMVAEALSVAAGITDIRKSGSLWEEYLSEARFVLRLLNEVERDGWFQHNVRRRFDSAGDWLLDLARQP